MKLTIPKWSTTRIAWAGAGAVALALIVLVAVSLTRPAEVDPRRVAVEAYIAEVNIVGQGLAAELTGVNETYRSIADAATGDPAAMRKLVQAEASVAKLGDRLAKLEVPSDAAELHRRLLVLARLQSSFAKDVTRLARYLIAVRAEASALTKATTSLSTTLKSSTEPGEQQAAFARYATALGRAADELDASEVPAALAPIQTAEVARVETLARLSGELRDALVAGNGKEVERLLAEVGRVSQRSLGSIERRSIIAYNSHQKSLAKAGLEVEQEHTRLTKELG